MESGIKPKSLHHDVAVTMIRESPQYKNFPKWYEIIMIIILRVESNIIGLHIHNADKHTQKPIYICEYKYILIVNKEQYAFSILKLV